MFVNQKYLPPATPHDIIQCKGPGRAPIDPACKPPRNDMHGKRPIDHGFRGMVSQERNTERDEIPVKIWKNYTNLLTYLHAQRWTYTQAPTSPFVADGGMTRKMPVSLIKTIQSSTRTALFHFTERGMKKSLSNKESIWNLLPYPRQRTSIPESNGT